MAWQSSDPALVTSIETAHLAEVARQPVRRPSLREAHASLLATAIHRSDRTNGGLRYRALDDTIRAELEDRLLRYLRTTRESRESSPRT